jgi:hypothetical protein
MAGLVMHWDGASWSNAPGTVAPGFAFTAFGLWGSSNDDVWAVGQYWAAGEDLFHWDGARWSVAPSDFPGHGAIAPGPNAIWGSGSDDVWAVGQCSTCSDAQQGSWHFDGSSWTSVPGGGGTAVWGSGPDDVWTVGNVGDTPGGTIFHWTESEWGSVPTGLTDTAVFNAVWGADSTNAWIVGTRSGSSGNDAGLVLHWDGSSWSTVPSPDGVLLTGIWGSSASDVWAVGTGAIHWDGTAWSEMDVPADTFGSPNVNPAVWGTGANDVWIVGASLAHWDGTSWSSTPILRFPNFGVSSIWGTSDTVWLGGPGEIQKIQHGTSGSR